MSSSNNRFRKTILPKSVEGLRPARVQIGSALILTVQDEYGNLPNWVTKIKRLMEIGLISLTSGSISDLEIRHDDWCRIHADGLCNCDPEIEVKRL